MIAWFLADVRNMIITALVLILLGLGITLTYKQFEVLHYKSENAKITMENAQLTKDLGDCKNNVKAIETYTAETNQIRKETAVISQEIEKTDNQTGAKEDAQFFKVLTDIFGRLSSTGVLPASGADKLPAVLPGPVRTGVDPSGAK